VTVDRLVFGALKFQKRNSTRDHITIKSDGQICDDSGENESDGCTDAGDADDDMDDDMDDSG
jgi:hypothetical protein